LKGIHERMVETREKKELKIGTNGILRLGDRICFSQDNLSYKVLASDPNEYDKS